MSAADDAARAKAEADAREAAAAAERARVRRIQQQISELTAKVSSYNQILAELRSSKSNLTRYINEWTQVNNSCKSSQITKQVVVKNTFEGDCAKAISQKLPAAVKEMETNKTNIQKVIDSTGAQITKLSEHINSLNGKISRLRASI